MRLNSSPFRGGDREVVEGPRRYAGASRKAPQSLRASSPKGER
jgi:hypothetical protein